MKSTQNILFALICLSLGASGAYLGYRIMRTPLPTTEVVAVEAVALAAAVPKAESAVFINPATLITYKHFDQTTNKTYVEQELASSIMLGRNKEELQNIFLEWDILSFDSEEVILTRTIASTPPIAYTISHIADFLTVFYGDINEGNIKTITKIPTNHLHYDEKERLTNGIFVRDENELMRRLEDFGS